MRSKPHSDQFEAAFSDFLESNTYDDTEQALFALVRAAFAAGWEAANKAGKQISFPGRDSVFPKRP